MQTIVYQDRASGAMYAYGRRYPAQRSLFEEKRAERIVSGMEELSRMGNVNVFLLKRGKLRLIAERGL